MPSIESKPRSHRAARQNQAAGSLAEDLHVIGARLLEIQAVRFAAWACARWRRLDDYARLARRALGIIDEVANELDPENRALFLMNKWSGRDELVSVRMRELLLGKRRRRRRPGHRELCRAFREIDALTHWSVDHALGESRAVKLSEDATPDVALAWAREWHRASARAIHRGAIRLRWSLSLWWFPAHMLILHYHVLPDRTYLFRIARRHIDVVVLPVGRLHLAENMSELVEDEAALRRLAAQIGIVDALEQFPGVRRLVIVPHDVVAGIPFAALPINDRRLCSIVPITQVDRLERVLRKQRIEADRTGLFLSAGRANYAGSWLANLPDAEREAAAVLLTLGVFVARKDFRSNSKQPIC